MWCPHGADHGNAALARRRRVLQWLALIEHPDALPHDAALRIAGEFLCWLGDEPPASCGEVAEPRRELEPA